MFGKVDGVILIFFKSALNSIKASIVEYKYSGSIFNRNECVNDWGLRANIAQAWFRFMFVNIC